MSAASVVWFPPEPRLPEPELAAVRRVAELVRRAGGRAWLVGGVVRDALLGLPSKDADLEVYGLPGETLEAVLAGEFTVVAVGKSFGVLKLRGLEVDVALPRRDSRTGPGHRDFAIEAAPDLSLAEAAHRRDFTLNALLLDPLTGELADPVGGLDDLRAGRLRHVSPAFVEDPLRVLRAMQMVARFDLTAAPETIALCATLTPDHLPAERLFDEWDKLIRLGRTPSRGLRLLQATGWLRFFPELAALVGCPQDPIWHPEGDVWEHTCHVVDAFARQRLGDATEDRIVGLACLLHDIGKPATTVWVEGRWRSPGHAEAGVPIAEAFLHRLTRETALVEAVLPLVATHMRPDELYDNRAGPAAIRRLARAAGRLDRLGRVVRADHAGRPPLPAEPCPAVDWLQAEAARLAVAAQAPRPLLLGRHLLARGIAPGPAFKPILAEAFEAQLDGAFADEAGAVAWLDSYSGLRESPR